MANKDDLSVNINVGVNLDKASVDKTKEELQFLIELKKELGFGPKAKIQVGGYSVQDPSGEATRKASRKYEKMGGSWDGSRIADNTEKALARELNSVAESLSKQLKLKFVPQVAESLNEIEFKLPGSIDVFDNLQEQVEDFIVTAAGKVVVSPAMLIAAAERVLQNNPNLRMPSQEGVYNPYKDKFEDYKKLGVTQGPTPAFKDVANYDQKLSEEFGQFISQAIGDNPAAATKVSEFLITKLKTLMSNIIDDAQKARARVFESVKGSEGDDSAANIIRYADEAARLAIAKAEQKYGLQAGTTAMYAPGLVPKKFSSPKGPDVTNFNEHLFKGMSTPTSDPKQLLSVLVGDYSDEVTGAIMAAVPDPSKVAEPIAQILMNPYILGDKFANGYQEEINKALKRRAPAVAEQAAAAVTPSFSGFDQAKSLLLKQKAIADEQNKKLMVSMDTEFLGRKDFKGENITELSIMIKDLAVEGKKFVEVFKFMQTPTDDKAFYAMSGKFPAGSARSSKDMYERGQRVGIPPEEIGKPGDAQGNFVLYRKKIEDAIEVIKLINELGGVITGSNLSAETTALKKAVENINNSPFNSKLGMDKLSLPEYQRYNAKGEVSVTPFKNVFDPTKQISELISKDTSGRVAQIFDNKEMTKGVSAALGNVIVKIGTEFEEFFNQYEDSVKLTVDKKSFMAKEGDQRLPAHFASTDAKGSLIIVDFLEGLGTSASTLLTPAVKNINDKIMAKVDAILKPGGSGGGKGPTTPLASADKPDEGGGANRSSQAIQRAFLAANAYEQLTLKLTQQEKAIIATRIATLRQTEELIAISAGLLDREKKVAELQAEAIEIRRGLTDKQASRANQAAASGAQGPMESPGAQRYYEQVKGVVALRKEILELNEAGQKLELSEISLAVQQQRRGDVTEQLTQNLRKQLDANIANTQAGKDATAQIKNQMQDQVNAQKAVQRQTQSLMNTWVTSRYALYDIGNFYQNVSQNLIRAARAIFDTTKSYRSFETAFTSVERAMQLSQEGAVDLRNQFVQLSETIPVSFEEISRIATLGAQMGIAADGIVGFTETIAQFASITGISAETVAQQFGRIAELADVDPTEFNNLGSAVAFAGVNAVATESEILTLSQSIAAVSNQVGITAPEIIGLGTALASVGIPAEQARGVFTRVFADIDRAASLGGKSLKGLSQITGLSAEKISSSWGQEGAANEVFVALLKGLNASDNLTAAFDSLNIVETREINTLTRLAKNMDVVMQALDDSGMSFESATFLGDSFDKTVDNLDSKLTLLRTNFDSLTASLSAGFAPALGIVVDGMSALFRFLKGAEDSFLFRAVLPATGAVIALGAATAAGAAILAKLTAQLYAFRVAQINAANSPTAVDGTIKQVKALLGLNSGLIEVRNNVSGINERGLVEPVNFNGLIANQKKQQAELLKTKNLYYALGEQVKNTTVAKQAGAVTATQLARLEADLVNKAIAQQQNKINVEQLYLDQLTSARTAAASSGMKDQALLLDAEIATQTQRINGLKTQQLYITFYKGEAQVVRESTLRAYERIAASKIATEATRAEAAARLGNATAINLETRSASQAFTSLAGKITSFLGVAGLIATIIPTVFALVDAFKNFNKIDLTEAGGGLESLREAIKKDTLAVKEGTMVAVATAQVEYKKYATTTDSAATAIKQLTGLSDDAALTVNKVTEEFKKQNIAIGQNTKEWIANALYKALQDEDIDFTKMQQSMAELGLDFDQVIVDMVAAANGADINPLGNVDSQLDSLRKRRDELNRQAIQAGPNNVSQAIKDELTQIYSQIGAYEDLKNVLESVGVTFEKAFSQSAVWNAIKSALGLEGVENSITKLIDRYKKVAEAGKSLKPVMNDIKTAVIGMFSEADKTNKALQFDVRSASTIGGLIEIVSALIKTREAAVATSTAMANVGTSAFYTAAGRAALDAAMGTKELKEILASLQAVAAGAAVDLDGLGGAAESAADKIRRLLEVANSGVSSIGAFKDSIRSLGKALAESKSFDLNTSIGKNNIDAVLGVITAIGDRGGSLQSTLKRLIALRIALQDSGASNAAIKLVDNAFKKLGVSIDFSKKSIAILRKDLAPLLALFKKNLAEGASEAIDTVEKKVRTLSDYVSDLRGVLQSTFDFRYGKQTALDSLTSSWLGIKEASEQAEKSIKSANDEINQSVADKSVLQYQLSVAERYGDEKRAAVIRAKLAKLDQQILDQQKQLADANEAGSTTLVGNSKAAVSNRSKVRDLVTQYNSYLIALANTGMSSANLNIEAKKLEQEFLQQGTALGFAEEELKTYTSAFSGDFTRVINALPRDITLTVDTDPALRAINEFVAKAQTELAKIGTTTGTPVTTPTPTSAFVPTPGNLRPGPEKDGTFVGQIGPQGNWIWDGKKWLKRAAGGYVSGSGTGSSDSIPAMLSNGEFVIRSSSVSAYGLDFMNALNQQRVSFSPAQGSFSGSSSAGPSVVYLSPEDRALLRAAVDRPIALYTENTKIAQSANTGNVLLAQRGAH